MINLGYETIDSITNGLKPGDLVIAKSETRDLGYVLACNIMANVCKYKRVAYLNVYSSRARIHRKISEINSEFNSSSLEIYDGNPNSFEEQIDNIHNVDLIIIGDVEQYNLNADIENFYIRLKVLAQEKRIPIIAIKNSMTRIFSDVVIDDSDILPYEVDYSLLLHNTTELQKYLKADLTARDNCFKNEKQGKMIVFHSNNFLFECSEEQERIINNTLSMGLDPEDAYLMSQCWKGKEKQIA